MAIALSGVAAGIIASFWISTALRQFLYGVTPHDALSFAAVAFALLVVSAVATIVPAKRAASVDPVRALRS
jgi:ABC-type lipoprotein release transport system permease subunit